LIHAEAIASNISVVFWDILYYTHILYFIHPRQYDLVLVQIALNPGSVCRGDFVHVNLHICYLTIGTPFTLLRAFVTHWLKSLLNYWPNMIIIVIEQKKWSPCKGMSNRNLNRYHTRRVTISFLNLFNLFYFLKNVSYKRASWQWTFTRSSAIAEWPRDASCQ